MRGKSPLERNRTLITWLFVPLWLTALLTTQAVGFETPVYDVIEFFGFFLVFAAVLGRLWCILYIGGRKDMDLCRSGPYSLSRNPLYLFSFLGLMGICLAAQNIILAFISAAVFFFYYRMVIINEEKRLRKIFGIEFISYMSDVPRFFPRFTWLTGEETLLVHSRAFTRSIVDVSWFLFAIVGIEVIEELRGAAMIPGWELPI